LVIQNMWFIALLFPPFLFFLRPLVNLPSSGSLKFLLLVQFWGIYGFDILSSLGPVASNPSSSLYCLRVDDGGRVQVAFVREVFWRGDQVSRFVGFD